MARINSVRANVLRPGGVKVVAVLPHDAADVYCMQVPDTGCFSIVGGIIVANCSDEMTYEISRTTQRIGYARIRGF